MYDCGMQDPVTAYRRMEQRLAAGLPPRCGDLTTLWEAYQAAVLAGTMHGETRLPDDLVAEIKADHDAMVRELGLERTHERRGSALELGDLQPCPRPDEDRRRLVDGDDLADLDLL
jgi:hypothetical protein